MPLIDYLGPALGFGGTSVGAFGLWHASRAKTQVEAEDTARDNDREDWQAMLAEQRQVIATIRVDLDAVREEVRDLRTALDRIRSLYRAALDHIRDLRGGWPAGAHRPPELPDALRTEL